jgi:adenylate cyclase class IV
MEIEVVLQEGEAVTDGEQVVRQLLAALGVLESALVEKAYVDLLASARGTPAAVQPSRSVGPHR